MNPNDLISILQVLAQSNFSLNSRIEIIADYCVQIEVLADNGFQYLLEINCENWLQGVANFPVKIIDYNLITGDRKNVATLRLGSLDKFVS